MPERAPLGAQPPVGASSPPASAGPGPQECARAVDRRARCGDRSRPRGRAGVRHERPGGHKPLLVAGWSPGAAILVRLTIGALLLAGPALLALRGRWEVLRAAWPTVLGFGLLGVAGASTLFFLAVDRLPVAIALLVEYTGPLLLVAWGWIRSRRLPSRTTLVGAAFAAGGLVLVLDVTGALDPDPVGLLFALGAAVGNAAYFAIVARPTCRP